MQKRIAPPLVIGSFGMVLGTANLLNGLISGSGARSSMAQVLETLELLEQRVDEIAEGINNILKHQAHLANVAHYRGDVHRVEYLLHHFEREISYVPENDTFVPADLANQWADACLSLAEDGLGQKLLNIHKMIKGGENYSPDSIFKTYEALLDRSSPSYLSQLQQFVEYTMDLQTAGYTLWINARIIKGIDIEPVQDRLTERLALQIPFLSELGAVWPGGSWGIPMPAIGCPYNHRVTFGTGYRFHHTQNHNIYGAHYHPTNAVSNPNHFTSGDVWYNLKQRFCMKTSGGDGEWPAGDYCIFADEGCPAGFRCGYLFWDDEDSSNSNGVSGELPRGIYNRNTMIYYGCRDDGSASTEIVLPALKPFYLFRFHNTCQQVGVYVITCVNRVQ